jgi:CDP-diacylglycerol---glycerol-3-phosphate 3-phosphatidyltransferase
VKSKFFRLRTAAGREETRSEEDAGLFDGRWRTTVEHGVAPMGSSLGARRLKPDHLTALGLVMAVVCAVVIASGHLFVGLLLLILSAVPDLLDGAVAKATGMSSVRGAFFDSVTDRVTDSLVLGGIAWHLATVGGGHAALLPFAVLATSTLISYERAKAESLGFDAKGGLMERAERIIALCVGLAFGVLVPVLWLMLALTSATAVQRFVKVWRQAPGPRATVADGEGETAGQVAGTAARDGCARHQTTTSRWREWRDTREASAGRRDDSERRWGARRRGPHVERVGAGSVDRAWRRRDRTRP